MSTQTSLPHSNGLPNLLKRDPLKQGLLNRGSLKRASLKRGVLISLAALSVAAFASPVFAQSEGNRAQASLIGEKYAGTETPVPISEAEFLNTAGLGYNADPDLVSGNRTGGSYPRASYPDGPYTELAANLASAQQHGENTGDLTDLPDDLPGLHRPALPASQNPFASTSAPSPVATPAVIRPVPASTVTPISPSAAPVPSALIDTSNTNRLDAPGLTSVSAGRERPVPPASSVTVPSLTPADYDGRTPSNQNLLSDNDLSFPPASAGGGLPLPEVDLPPQAVVVESSLSGKSKAKSARDGDFAFVTRQLDKVGVNSQRLKVEIGTGMMARPTYRGSNDTEVSMVPHADIEYMDRFFLSTERGVGVTVFNNKNFDADVFGTWRKGRKAEGDIRHFAKKDGGIALGFEVGSGFGPFRLSLNSDYGVTGDIGGLKADLDLSYRQSIGNKFTAGLTVGSRFGDAKYIDSRFGATRNDYSRSSLGIGLFQPKSAGMVDFHAGLETAYRFTPGLSLNLDLSASKLTGDAATSPIVNIFGSTLQWQSSLSTRYKF